MDIRINLPTAGCEQPKYVLHYQDFFYCTRGHNDELGFRTKVEFSNLLKGQREVILPGILYNRKLQIELVEHCGDKVKAFVGQVKTRLGSK